MSTIVLASYYGGIAGQAAHQGHDSHDSYAPEVSPDELGGSYEFLDLKNRPVAASAFGGHWSLLFFGYARCRGSCPVATPRSSRRRICAPRIETRAVFATSRRRRRTDRRRATAASAAGATQGR